MVHSMTLQKVRVQIHSSPHGIYGGQLSLSHLISGTSVT